MPATAVIPAPIAYIKVVALRHRFFTHCEDSHLEDSHLDIAFLLTVKTLSRAKKANHPGSPSASHATALHLSSISSKERLELRTKRPMVGLTLRVAHKNATIASALTHPSLALPEFYEGTSFPLDGLGDHSG